MGFPPSQSGFEQLHPGVQRWIWEQGWPSLRPIQDQAIAPILAGQTDVMIAAATAGGKTEAAFLPLFSKLLTQPEPGIRVLGVSPLKALINDQQRRLSELGDRLQVPVTAWHGDIAAPTKHKLFKHPDGIVLITPESLEALLARRGALLPQLFPQLAAIVIDEMHCFIGSERGCQLQSLMHRLEQVSGRFIPRIGLSATLGDMGLAADFLRPGGGDQVVVICPPGGGGELRVQVRGYRKTDADADSFQLSGTARRDEVEICRHLFQTLRGSRNLIFMNGRGAVEKYADLLAQLCTQQQVPNEFWPHHGSLAKDLREAAETLLKSDRPANLVCTTTLEMGIDVGDVRSIAQVGAPQSVASMRQRLGRSGRRPGEPAIARFYVSVANLTTAELDNLPPQERLHGELVQAIAVLNLMLAGWCEPPIVGNLHLSTLIQQILSLIAQQGGLSAAVLWHILCKTGPFRSVTPALFTDLLRCLGHHGLIQQSQDGSLLLGLPGERQVNHYTFYAAFQASEDYRLVHEGRTLGTLPMTIPLRAEMQIIYAGQRWRALAADDWQKVVEVVPAATGKTPSFSGGCAPVHDRVRQEMYRVYTQTDRPNFLDAIAQDLLAEARQHFRQYQLHQRSLLEDDGQTLLFCWQGDRVMNTLWVQLLARGLRATRDDLVIAVDGVSAPELLLHLGELVDAGPADAEALAATVTNRQMGKHDRYLSEPLQCLNYGASHLDTQSTWQQLKQLVDG